MERIVFCDLDGSLIHGTETLSKWGKLAPHPDKDGLYSYLDLVSEVSSLLH